MFTDFRFPLLLIKSKKLSEQPGMILTGHPARWHKINPGDEVPKDAHHALHKKGEIAAATKLSKDPEFQKLSPEEQVKKVQEHAKAVQDKNTASSKAATFIQKIMTGKPPQQAEWKHWIAQSREKRLSDIAKFNADPQTKANWEQAISTYKAMAAASIERHKAGKEPEKAQTVADKTEPVKEHENDTVKTQTTPVSRFELGKEISALIVGQGESSLKPSQKTIKQAASNFGVSIKEARKSLDAFNYGDSHLKPHEVVDVLSDSWSKTQEVQSKPVKAEEPKPEPVTEAKEEKPEPDEYESKIAEYATGATYKQKAHKLLSQDPEWQKLSGKAKLDALHAKYLEMQAAASLSGAMAKFKAALLDGKSPTKALVEKFNSLSKEDQAKVLKPVFEKKDKAEIGKLLEQSGAKPESQKASEPESKADNSPKDGDTKQGADGLLVFKNGRWHKQGEDVAVSGETKPEAEPAKPVDTENYKVGDKLAKPTDIQKLPPGSVVNFFYQGKVSTALIGQHEIWFQKKNGKGWQKNPLTPQQNTSFKGAGYYTDKMWSAYSDQPYEVVSLGSQDWMSVAQKDKVDQFKEALKDKYPNAKLYRYENPKQRGIVLLVDPDQKKPIAWFDEKGQTAMGFSAKQVAEIKDGKIVEIGNVKLSQKAAQAMAYELGKQAFDKGYVAPAADPGLVALIDQYSNGFGGSIPFLDAWNKGHIQASADAPVPGWNDKENQQYQQQVGQEPPKQPTEVHHGAAWVTALAEGKKPDSEHDNAVVTMPEERQQELMNKAATLWAKNQKLDADPNGASLGNVVLRDVMSNIEHKEGNTKTVNGVTYILQNGRWHRQTPKPIQGEGTPKQKLDSLQSLDIQDLYNEVADEKISAKTDAHLDVMGPDAKATFYNMLADYNKSFNTVYLKGAYSALVGHPNEILLKTGQWVPFDTGWSSLETLSPSGVFNKGIEEATLAAQNEPSSGPENPDTPQSFGHGTVTFVGPQSIHEILSGKDWNMAAGPKFQTTFLNSKSIKDWSISPGDWVDDKALWNKNKWYLKDMFPEGAVVDFGDKKYTITHGAKSLDFTNQQTGETQSFSKKEQIEGLLAVIWQQNPKVIPPGHPAGKKIRDEAADKVEVASPEVEYSFYKFKKINGTWHQNLISTDWTPTNNDWLNSSPVTANGHASNIEALESKLAGLSAQNTADNGAQTEEPPVFNINLPGGGSANYKKIGDVWMTENQNGNPDAGWHPINQDGWMVPVLEDKLKASGGQYDPMQHPMIKQYIQSLANGLNPSADHKAQVDFLSPKDYEAVFSEAAKSYAQQHNLDINDKDDESLAESIVFDLAAGEDGPKENDIKVINGITYQLINGRWHRQTPKDDIINDLPGYPGVNFKKVGDKWQWEHLTGQWKDVKIVDILDALHAYEANKSSKASQPLGPLDAINIPSQAIDASKLKPLVKDKLKEQLEQLKEAAKKDGISAFKGVLKHMSASNKTIVKLPNGGYKFDVHNPESNTTVLGSVLNYINDLKAATELASGKKPPKKPKKAAKTNNAAAPTTQPGVSTESIDNWKQIGGQGGFNPGGTFQDPNGEEWYCKFPDKGEHNVKNEMLAIQLYKAAGVNVPEVKLVTQNGKIGLASKIIQGAKEDKAWLKNGGGPGVMEGFAIDAWLANWDTVGNNPAAGKGFDNILKMPDGSAARIDAGGALLYGGAGSLKGDKFGDTVDELESLRNASINPNTAQVFGKMTEADIKASVTKLAGLSDNAIKNLVYQYGPGDFTEKNSLIAKLIARKSSILGKYPEITKELNKAKLATFDSSVLGTPPDFLNWKGPGQPGPATLQAKNEANQDGVNKLHEAAKAGDIDAVKSLDFPLLDNSGNITGYAKALDHPSQYVRGYAQQIINEIDSYLNPPEPFVFAEGSPIAALDAAYPPVNVGQHTKKVGKFLIIGDAGEIPVADMGLPNEKFTMKNGKLTTGTYAKAAQSSLTKMPKLQKDAVRSYTGGGYHSMNNGLWEGNPTGAAISAGEALHTLGHEIAPGTVLGRKLSLYGSDLEQFMGSLAGGSGKGMLGKVLQEPAILSTSISPDAWSGNVHFKMNIGPGVKGLYVDIGSDPSAKSTAFSMNPGPNEREIILPPNTRFVVNKISKSGGDPDGFGNGPDYIVEVTILPSKK